MPCESSATTACNAATHPGHMCGHAVQHCDAPWSHVRPRRATLRRALVTCAATPCNTATRPGHTCDHAVQHCDAPWSHVRPRRATLRRTLVTRAATACSTVPLCESHVRLTARISEVDVSRRRGTRVRCEAGADPFWARWGGRNRPDRFLGRFRRPPLTSVRDAVRSVVMSDSITPSSSSKASSRCGSIRPTSTRARVSFRSAIRVAWRSSPRATPPHAAPNESDPAADPDVVQLTILGRAR